MDTFLAVHELYFGRAGIFILTEPTNRTLWSRSFLAKIKELKFRCRRLPDCHWSPSVLWMTGYALERKLDRSSGTSSPLVAARRSRGGPICSITSGQGYPCTRFGSDGPRATPQRRGLACRPGVCHGQKSPLGGPQRSRPRCAAPWPRRHRTGLAGALPGQ